MQASCSLQSELRHDLKDLLHLAASRPVVHAIVARVRPKISEGHADLASSLPSSPVRGQSRLIRITDNKGCVRYPTEGNSSNHELTTAMHHLSSTLEGYYVSAVCSWISNLGKVLRLATN